MNATEHYAQTEPSRAEVDAMHGPVLLEFGTAWCGHCRAAQPGIAIVAAAGDHQDRAATVLHQRIGKLGRRLAGAFHQGRVWQVGGFQLADGGGAHQDHGFLLRQRE